MKYQLSFHDSDQYRETPDLVFHGQNQPLIPRVGELVRIPNSKEEQKDYTRRELRQVKQVEYLYEGDTSI